jgi:U3 small nucleolar RNA-associated protein 4
MTSYVLLIELGSAEQKPQVLRRFGNHRSRNAFGERVADQPDDEFTPIGFAHGNGESESVANVLRLAVSADGQWLATSDDLCRTHVFNLDSLQV